MKRAMFLTAYNRPDYLKATLDSWRRVRGVKDWTILATVDPSDQTEDVLLLLHEFQDDHENFHIVLNPERYGVLHHPWVYFERFFKEGDFDYVVRAEDDILVSADILEYHEWASSNYRWEESVGWITSFADDYRDHAEARRQLGFGSPLIIGTWADRWRNVFGPTWDHDYSTNNGTPGVMAGWDHNLNRVMPERGLHSIIPTHTKVFHVGVHGQHSTPEIYFRAPAFAHAVPRQAYRECQ